MEEFCFSSGILSTASALRQPTSKDSTATGVSYGPYRSTNSNASFQSGPYRSLGLPTGSGATVCSTKTAEDAEELQRYVDLFSNMGLAKDAVDLSKDSAMGAEVCPMGNVPAQEVVDLVDAEVTPVAMEAEVCIDFTQTDSAKEVELQPMANAQASQMWVATPVQTICMPYFVPVPVPCQTSYPCTQSVGYHPYVFANDESKHAALPKAGKGKGKGKGTLLNLKKTGFTQRYFAQQLENELPPATEEEWLAREEKRKEGMDNLRASDVYKLNQDIPESERPPSPDPTDRTVAKRKWEKAIAACRAGWRRTHNVRRLTRMGFRKRSADRAWTVAKEDFDEAVRILKVEQIVAMGFSKKRATIALKQARHNVDRAIAILVKERKETE